MSSPPPQQTPQPATGSLADDALPVRVIRPRRRVPLRDVLAGWPLAKVIAARDLKAKFKQSVLGSAWLVVQPLGTLVGLLVVFNGVTKVDTGGVPYMLFALVGLATWSFVQTAVMIGTASFTTNTVLIKRVACPRIGFVIANVLSSMVNPCVIFIFAVAGLLLSGHGLPAQALAYPLLFVWLVVMVSGILLVSATLMVRFRDVGSLLPFFFQAGLFLTPVGYMAKDAPPTIESLLAINPLTGLLDLTRWSLIGTDPQTLAIVSSVTWTVVFVVGGWRIFTTMEPRFADWI